MAHRLHPAASAETTRAFMALLSATRRMPRSVRALWTTRTAHIYGDLGGQRKLDVSGAAADCGVEGYAGGLFDLLFALHTYFVLVAELAAVACLEERPAASLRGAAERPDDALRAHLRRVASGRALEDKGVYGARSAFHFEWFVDALPPGAAGDLRGLLLVVATELEDLVGEAVGDPIGALYADVMPKNLLHALGEFYTPPWLADQLLQEVGWQPGETLIDTFCGSGVFLVAAIRRARAARHPGVELLQSLCGVDLNPVSCAATRANLVIALRGELRAAGEPVYLPILCADTMASSICRLRQRAPSLLTPRPQVMVDGEYVEVPDRAEVGDAEVARQLAAFGVRLGRWLPSAPEGERGSAPPPQDPDGAGDDSRRYWEQLAALRLAKARFLVTNPPWIGWEYLSRPYRAYIQPGWEAYGLFTAKGRDAAFLKEDISTLALITAWDTHLQEGGRSAVVLRTSTMTSSLASRGMRRLRLFEAEAPIGLTRVNDLAGVRVFASAQTEAATWQIVKGEETTFPVPCVSWSRSKPRWQPTPSTPLSEVLERTSRSDLVVQPVDPEDWMGRWMIGHAGCVASSDRLTGPCAYKGRTGVFTGGANAVFYLEETGGASTTPGSREYSNVVRRAKRAAPKVKVRLETELVYEVVRGRDIGFWQLRGHGLLLCPHTAETKMKAIHPAEMAKRYPLTLRYLTSMRSILDERQGFTGWERAFQEEAFYAIQRIGEYTFAEHKVAWKYIASAFTVAVIGPDAGGRPRLPNDKVMSVAVSSAAEAYYLCAVLSSSPVRWQVTAHTSGRQISASAIEDIAIPAFEPQSKLHQALARECERGHLERRSRPGADISGRIAAIDARVGQLFGIEAGELERYRREAGEVR